MEDLVPIDKSLTHLDKKDASAEASRLPLCRAPPICVWPRTGRPQAGLFDG
jgi:hypothetical protein